MRFFTSILLLCASVVCITLGIGQQTWLKPPSTQSVSITTDSDAPLTVVDGTALTQYPGKVTLSISGADKVLAATTSTEDVDAWVADAKVNRVVFDADTDEPSVQTSGTEAPVPNPTGSDLWVQEATADNSLTASFDATVDQSVLISADGTEAAPSHVTMTWRVDNSMPWAIPLIIVGTVLLALGILLLLLAIHRDRIQNGPRRKSRRMAVKKGAATGLKVDRRKHGRRAAGSAMVVAAVAVASLGGGLSAQAADTDTPSESAEQTAVPPVTESHFGTILTDVATVANAADESLDAKSLATRFAGAAYEVRSVNYTIRGKDASFARPDPIASSKPALFLPPIAHTWPRQVFTIVDDPNDDANAMAMMLEQAAPRDNYKVMYITKLVPTSDEFPSVAAADVGGVALAPDTSLLTISPADLPAAYSDVIENGAKSASAALFDYESDPFITATNDRQEQARKDIGSRGTVSFSRKPSDVDPMALSTADSGAIVAVYLQDIEVSKPKSNSELKISSKALQALLGKTTTTKSVTATYGDMLLFYVPPIGDRVNTARLLGVTSGLVSAGE